MTIKSELKSGVFYTIIFRYAGIFSQIFTTSVLARLLTPEEFGVVVAVFVISAFFSLISDSGLAVAIIQKRELTSQDIYSLFIITLFSGIVLSSVFALSGPLISDFYNNSVYLKITPLLAISLFFYSAHIVPSATLYRDNRFKAIGIITFTVQFSSAILAIILAWQGFSYYALVYQAIFAAVLKFLIVIILSPVRLHRKINFGVLKNIFNYSLFKMLYDILNYFSRNLDNILIGKYLGAVPLGYYDKAYKLMLMPVGNLADVVSPVLHPVLSKHQDNPELIYSVYKKISKFLSTLGIALSIYLFFSAKEIIIILFGNQWLGSVMAFKYLALAIWIQMVLSGSGSIFLSLGKSNYLFLSGFISSAILVTAIFLGIFIEKSIVGVSALILVSFIINLFQVSYFLIIKILKNRLTDFFSSFRTGIIIGFTLLAANLIISLTFNNINIILAFSIKLIVSSGLFIIMLIILKEFRSFIDIAKLSKK